MTHRSCSQVFTAGGQTIRLPLTGTADFGHHRLQLRIGLPPGDKAVRRVFRKQGFPYDEIYSGTLLWHRDTKVARVLPGAKQWALIDRVRIGEVLGVDVRRAAGLDTRDPSKWLPFMRRSNGLRKLGVERVGGVPATHYRGTIDLRRALGATPEMPAAQARVERALRISRLPNFLPVEVWLDGKGFVRRHRVTVDPIAIGRQVGRSVITEEYSGYSRALAVAPPPAAEVTDTTEATAQAVKKELGS